MTTSDSTADLPEASDAPEVGAAHSRRSRPDTMAQVKRFLPYVLTALAVFLWWPSGWSGSAQWWEFPLKPTTGAVLFLGAFAAAAVVSALTREPWLKFGIVVALGLLSWWGTAGDVVVSGRLVLIGLLVVGSLLGLWLGARSRSGVSGTATVLAVLAGVSPSDWPHGPLLAVALALPFWQATRDRVAPTIWAIVRVLAVYVVSAVVAMAFSGAWVTHTRSGLTPFTPILKRIGTTMWESLKTHGVDTAQHLLTAQTHWYWVAGILAIILVLARHFRVRLAPAKD